MKTFKEFIQEHDPLFKFDFDNPEHLAEQFVRIIKDSGYINMQFIYEAMSNNSGLTPEQEMNFRINSY